MVNWMYFPHNRQIENHLVEIIDVFKKHEKQIDSETHSLVSNDVLEIVLSGLENLGYDVEKSKRKSDKIRVPVLFGKNGQVNLAFEVDAYSAQYKTAIEVEAGRAVVNYQFLKDFYEACMMQGVDFLCLAIRNTYRNKKDFDKVCGFFETMCVSNRFDIPLEGILVIGY